MKLNKKIKKYCIRTPSWGSTPAQPAAVMRDPQLCSVTFACSVKSGPKVRVVCHIGRGKM